MNRIFFGRIRADVTSRLLSAPLVGVVALLLPLGAVHADPMNAVAVGTVTLVAVDTSSGDATQMPRVPVASGPSTSLASVVAPLPDYPRMAIRQFHQGEVVLKLLIAEDGRPLDVVVAQSSGYRELDRSALTKVRDEWRFAAPTYNGRATKAWGVLPVRFTRLAPDEV